MTIKLAKSAKITRFPRPIKTVTSLLESVLKQSKTHRFRRCVIVLLDDTGQITTCHSNGKNVEIIGLLEMAKIRFHDQM